MSEIRIDTNILRITIEPQPNIILNSLMSLKGLIGFDVTTRTKVKQ